jgi:hypothetical protein
MLEMEPAVGSGKAGEPEKEGKKKKGGLSSERPALV